MSKRPKIPNILERFSCVLNSLQKMQIKLKILVFGDFRLSLTIVHNEHYYATILTVCNYASNSLGYNAYKS